MSPRIEMIAIGDELLSGATINKNSAFMSHALYDAGYKTARHTTISDTKTVITQTLQESFQRAHITLCTGGLGPTLDDLTLDCATKLFPATKMIEDQKIFNELKARYGDAHPAVRTQALVPDTAQEIYLNKLGSAPGILFSRENSHLILLPGVPHEMEALFLEHVLPFIQKTFPLKERLYKRSLGIFNVNEIDIDDILRPLQKKYPKLQFGIYPHIGTVSIHIKIMAKSEQEAMEAINPAYNTLTNYFSKNSFQNASNTLCEALHNKLIEKKLTLCCAESCTGGSLTATLAAQPGASKYLWGSFVSYAPEMKIKVLNVSKTTLETMGAVSEETVTEMAENARIISGTSFSVAISGIAGPTGGSAQKPVGTVWIAVASSRGTITKQLKAKGTREMIIQFSINNAMALLLHDM